MGTDGCTPVVLVQKAPLRENARSWIPVRSSDPPPKPLTPPSLAPWPLHQVPGPSLAVLTATLHFLNPVLGGRLCSAHVSFPFNLSFPSALVPRSFSSAVFPRPPRSSSTLFAARDPGLSRPARSNKARPSSRACTYTCHGRACSMHTDTRARGHGQIRGWLRGTSYRFRFLR